MNQEEAKDNIAFIKEMMQNSSRYGASIAGVYLFMGISGICGAIIGYTGAFGQSLTFVEYWMGVAVIISLSSSAFMFFRALKNQAVFRMGATQRLAGCIFPPCVAGATMGVAINLAEGSSIQSFNILVGVWVILFGCALNSASFVVSKGLKHLSWIYIFGGSITLMALVFKNESFGNLHLTMGFFFGVLFLIYSATLFLMEKDES